MGSHLGSGFPGGHNFSVTEKVDSCSHVVCTAGTHQIVHQLLLGILGPLNIIVFLKIGLTCQQYTFPACEATVRRDHS